MIRPHWLPAAAAVLALALPSMSGAHSKSHATSAVHGNQNHTYSFGDDDDFHWAIISDDGMNLSGHFDRDLIEELKERHEEPFLLIGEDDEAYLITDEDLVERAQRAGQRIREHATEIGALARAQARLSLGDSRLDRRVEKLERKRKALKKSIREAERQGDSTDELEQELFQVKVALQALEGVERSFALTSKERDELIEQRDEASQRLRRAVDGIKREMREISKTAKSRGLAERIRTR
jgi:hypothetical protein